MPGLNENHRRHLLLTFQHVDETLSRTFAAARQSQKDSLFQTLKYDFTPDQEYLIAVYLKELRRAMARIIRAHGLTIPEPQISALWAFRSTLLAVSNTLEEIRPQYMVGYGPVDESAREDLQTISAELLNIIDQLGKSLAEPPGGNISARLHRLGNPDQTAALAAQLAEIITRRNLVEIRPALAVLVERMEHTELEIAVFGRVSAGKSSLLNFLWQHDILPVGAVPVTTIPTRLIYGPVLKVTVKTGSDKSMVIQPTQIEDFVTQIGNPDNCKHVTEVGIELPCTRMVRGIAFVDTPGLGALGGQGSADALAYLPRCDIGLVLASAAVGLTDMDIELVAALRRAGGEIMVLLTKADLLPEHDLASVLTYAQDQLRHHLDNPPEIHAVSVRAPQAPMTWDWFDQSLAPLLGRAAALRAASIQHKLKQLGGTVTDILKRRAQAADATTRNDDDGNVAVLLAHGTMVLDAAGRVSAASLPTPRRLADDIIDRTAQTLAQGSWDVEKASQEISAIARARVTQTAGDIIRQLTDVRDQVERSLRKAADLLACPSPGELPPIAGLPIFDPASIAAAARPHVPTWTKISVVMRRHVLAEQFRKSVQSRLGAVLLDYNKRLWHWRGGMLGDLSIHYHAAAAVLRAAATACRGHCDGNILADIAVLEQALAQLSAAADRHPDLD